MNNNLSKYKYNISQEDRNKKNNHKSLVVWFTGLSGSGKSTIANRLEEQLFRAGINTYTLDGDNIRSGLNRGLGFTEQDRQENNRRVAEVSKLFVDAGLVAITAFISPLKEDREKARNLIGDDLFVEVFVNTPLRICEKRDVKGLYKRARAGEIENFTGIDSPYEAPDNPEIEIKTQEEPVEEAVERIFMFLKQKIKME